MTTTTPDTSVTTEGPWTCPACKEEHDEDYRDGFARWSTVLEDDICESCWDDDLQYASVAVVWGPGAKEGTGYGSEDTRDKYYIGSYNIVDKWYEDIYNGLNFTRTYHRIDGWRGYHATHIDGWTEVDGGSLLWGQSTKESDLLEFIQENEELLDFNVISIANLTSNVFSQAVDILVKDEDVEKWEEFKSTFSAKRGSW